VVVSGFAQALAETHQSDATAQMAKPLTMLLFGMINWMFTWMRPDGELDYDAMGQIVADLFLGGVSKVKPPAG
jgi:TetR/AcrR family transcriptional regulator